MSGFKVGDWVVVDPDAIARSDLASHYSPHDALEVVTGVVRQLLRFSRGPGGCSTVRLAGESTAAYVAWLRHATTEEIQLAQADQLEGL